MFFSYVEKGSYSFQHEFSLSKDSVQIKAWRCSTGVSYADLTKVSGNKELALVQNVSG